jgi:uncharacterized protein YraI
VAGALVGSLAFSTAQAAPGAATGDVNMRTGPGTNYAKIATITAGASVEVLGCPSWCQVQFAGRRGWVSSNYIVTGYYERAPAPIVVYERVQRPVVVYERAPMPPRAYWRDRRPWWDDRYETWYDGDSYWYEDEWYDQPRSGASVSFSFGR